MKFITALFTLYRNGEFLQFMKNVLSIVTNYDLATLKLTERVTKLTEQTTELDNVFQPQRGEELTDELKELDARRDKALMGIKNYLVSQTYREEVSIVNAAEALLENYVSHDDRIDKLPYQQETAIANTMLKDWETKPVLSAAVTTLTLTDWVNLLKTLNETFDTTYVERAQTAPEPANILAKREAIRKAYNDLIDDVEAYARISDNKEAYETIIRELNGLIDDYNTAANSRLKGNSNES